MPASAPAEKARARRAAPAAGGAKPTKPVGKAAAGGDDAALAKDVAAFASALGLAAAAGAAPADAAFDDFAPERAARKLGDGKKKPDAKPKGTADAGAAAAPRTPGRDARGDYAQTKPNPRPSRPWNAGAGPAPARAKSLIAKDGAGLWYEAAAAVEAAAGVPSAPLPAHAPADDAALASAREEAAALLAAEADAHRAALAGSRDADARWLARARASGTAADKVAAAAVAVADAPAASLGALDDLLKTASKRGGGRTAAIGALDALNDLFSGGALLPPNRRLVPLAARPLAALADTAPSHRAKVLLYWGLEDALRRRAGEHSDALAAATRDSVDAVKRAGVRGLAARLTAAPEGEADALTALVNKLGDPDRRLAAGAARALASVLDSHPAMAATVARYVERAAFRPGQAPRARHAAVLFLSTLPLPRGAGAAPLAAQITDCCFGLFRAIVDGTLGAAADARAAAAKAAEGAGAKAAARAAAAAKKKGRGGDDAPAVVQAEGVDARILAALLTAVRRAAPFLPPADADKLAARHADALFKLAAAAPFPTAVQALILLFQLQDAAAAVSDRFYRSLYARLADPAVPRSARAPQFLSLVYRAARADPSPPRVAAFVKRLLQSAAAAPPQFAAASLLLVSELARGRKHLWGLVSQPEDAEAEAMEAVRRAEKDEDEEEDGEAKEKAAPDDDDAGPTPPPASRPPTAYPCGYDPAKREPRGAAADAAGLWELVPLAAHAHPSVAAFARALLAGTPIAYAGDPLRDFAPAVALDKFLAKKPKAGDAKAAPPPYAGRSRAAAARPPPGSAEFAALAGADVAPDERYLHAWHAERAAKAAAKVAAAAATDDGSGSSDDDDKMDAFLARAEDGGGGLDDADADGGVDYSALAAAMAEDATARVHAGSESEEEEASDEEASDEAGSSSDSESDLPPPSDASDDDDDDHAYGASALDDLGGLAPGDLPSASGSSLPTDDSDSGSGSDGGTGGWTLAPSAPRPARRRRPAADVAFASADEFADLLDADAAGRDVTRAAAERAAAAGVAVKPRHKRARKK